MPAAHLAGEGGETPVGLHRKRAEHPTGAIPGHSRMAPGRASASSPGLRPSTPIRRQPASRDPRAAVVFEGVEEEIIGDFGVFGGAAALELKHSQPGGQRTLRHALVLASSGEGRTATSNLSVAGEGARQFPGSTGIKCPASIRAGEPTFREGRGRGGDLSTGAAQAGAGSRACLKMREAMITESVSRGSCQERARIRFIDAYALLADRRPEHGRRPVPCTHAAFWPKKRCRPLSARPPRWRFSLAALALLLHHLPALWAGFHQWNWALGQAEA